MRANSASFFMIAAFVIVFVSAHDDSPPPPPISAYYSQIIKRLNLYAAVIRANQAAIEDLTSVTRRFAAEWHGDLYDPLVRLSDGRTSCGITLDDCAYSNVNYTKRCTWVHHIEDQFAERIRCCRLLMDDYLISSMMSWQYKTCRSM